LTKQGTTTITTTSV